MHDDQRESDPQALSVALEQLEGKESQIQAQHRSLLSLQSITNEQTATIGRLQAELAQYAESSGAATTLERERAEARLKTQIAQLEESGASTNALLEVQLQRMKRAQSERLQMTAHIAALDEICKDRLRVIDDLAAANRYILRAALDREQALVASVRRADDLAAANRSITAHAVERGEALVDAVRHAKALEAQLRRERSPLGIAKSIVRPAVAGLRTLYRAAASRASAKRANGSGEFREVP